MESAADGGNDGENDGGKGPKGGNDGKDGKGRSKSAPYVATPVAAPATPEWRPRAPITPVVTPRQTQAPTSPVVVAATTPTAQEPMPWCPRTPGPLAAASMPEAAPMTTDHLLDDLHTRMDARTDIDDVMMGVSTDTDSD